MKNILLLAILLATLGLHAQTSIWAKDVSKNAFMSQLEDGKIFLKDKTKIHLINHQTGEVEWENEVEAKKDPKFLHNLPIMYFEGKSFAVIDATTGHVIDKSLEQTEVLNITYFWEKGRVVLELERKNHLHILNIDLNDLSKSWNSKIGKVQKTLMGLVSRETENTPSISQNGSILLVDKNFISFVGADGSISNRIEFKKKIKKLGYNQTKDILYILEDKKKLHFIDASNGSINGTKELKEKGIQFNILGDQSTVNVVQKKDLKILDGVEGTEISTTEFKDKIYQTHIDEENGDFYVLSKKILAQINPKNGEILRSTEFKSGYEEIYQVHQKTIVSKGSKANIIDLANFKLLYSKDIRIPPVNDYIEMGDLVGFTYQGTDKFSLYVVDPNGKTIWKKEITSLTKPSLDVLEHGLLIMSDTKVQFLNPSDGKSIWKGDVKVDPSFTFVIDDATNDLFMYTNKRLYIFDFETGDISRSKEKFKFKDFDYNTQRPQMLIFKDNIFLKGSNTIYVVSKEGELIHEKTYRQISNTSGLLKLANAAVTISAIGSGNAHKVLTVYQNDRLVYKGDLVDGLNDNWAYAENLRRQRLAKQNRSSNDFPYVFTKLKSNKTGLIFLDPENGEERFEIELDEKNPDYIVDDIDGLLFHRGKTALKAYDLN